mgnify:CR=1 FL=1
MFGQARKLQSAWRGYVARKYLLAVRRKVGDLLESVTGSRRPGILGDREQKAREKSRQRRQRRQQKRAAIVIQRLVRGVQARQRTLLVGIDTVSQTINVDSLRLTRTWVCIVLIQDHKMHLIKVLHHLWTQRPRFIGYEVFTYIP